MSREIMNADQKRKPFSFSLPPLLLAQIEVMTTNPKDPEMLNRNLSRAAEILIRRGMKAK